jgi:hypothetical protein
MVRYSMDQITIKKPNPKYRLYNSCIMYMLTTQPDPLPPLTHCMNTYPCAYSYREWGGGGVEANQ